MQKILKGSPAYFQATGQWDESRPMYCIMNLDTPCHYNCRKCALNEGGARVAGTPMSQCERKKTLSLTNQVGVKSLVVIGIGEPTDNQGFPIVRPLIEHAHNLGMVTILFTTLYGLTQKIAEFFFRHNTSLYISLDSLDLAVYRFLTGNGKLNRILQRIDMLRSFYQPENIGGQKVVRLGINTTVVRQNKCELENIRRFAGEDIHFVANPPMHRGRLNHNSNWQELVGNDYNLLAIRASAASETCSHSSVHDGVCSYFFRGVSVDIDGKLLSCGYAGETAGLLSHASSIHSAQEYLKHYAQVQSVFQQFVAEIGYRPSCPLRDEHYLRFVSKFGNSPFKILHNGNS